ncbi:hypothetical protein RB653_010515 [Dictyostelium firmibasis]|uniref:ShKT domain-containing protein n=1 Tax=Dictyostelium firmibasis TaxID=79012 RepID=A0AAN7TU31_9MYCE
MIKIFIVLLVIVSLLSNLNLANGKNISCFVDCINDDPNFHTECSKSAFFKPNCRSILKKCRDQCRLGSSDN